MANVCSCFINVEGKSAKGLLQRVMDQDPSLEKVFTWFLHGSYYGLVQDPKDLSGVDDLLLEFTCKWAPPLDYLSELSKDYPDCTFNLRYDESGMELYGTVVCANGEILEDNKMEEEQYLKAFNEDYQAETKAIKGSTYKEFLKNISGMDDLSDEFVWHRHLERHYLNRIKDEDLPLIINHEWLDYSNKEIYLKRIKGG